MHPHSMLISLFAAFTIAQSPYEACYGNVAYCASGPIILRCDGTSLGPGNCDDNLNHPQYGAICIESSNTAGNAICSAVGSSAPPFPSVTGGLGTPTASSTMVVSTTSSSSQVATSASTSASASSQSASVVTVTSTSTCCSCNGTTGISTSYATSSRSATTVNSTLTLSRGVSVTVTPTTTKSVTPVFTGAAVSMLRGGKDAFNLAMAGALVIGTMIAGAGIVWRLG